MVPLKVTLSFEPPQIGILYNRHPKDSKKQLYIIHLNEVVFMGDSAKITKILYQNHEEYLSSDKVKPAQVQRLVEKLLEDLQ